MKKVSLIVMLLIAVMMIIGCSHNAEVSKNADEDDSVSFSASNTENHNSKIVTENESSTEVSTTKTTTTQSTIKPKGTKKSTASKTTTTKPVGEKSAGQCKVKKQTQTTTKRQTTTKKHTTTKKVTTTEDDWDCNVDGHSCEVGQIGWVNSEAEATDKALEYIGNHDASGNFRVEHCYWCGKYTASIKLN